MSDLAIAVQRAPRRVVCGDALRRAGGRLEQVQVWIVVARVCTDFAHIDRRAVVIASPTSSEPSWLLIGCEQGGISI